MAMDTVKRGGSRFYFDPAAPDKLYPGVTSIVDMLPSNFLPRWYAKMAGDIAVDSIDYFLRMAERDPDGARRWISGAAYRYTQQRSRIGSQAHDMFERIIRGQKVGRVHPDMIPYQRHFDQFLKYVQPRLIRAEDIAYSAQHQYMGSFDAWLEVLLDENGRLDLQGEPALSMVDWKTGKRTYPQVALQLSGYTYADTVISADGTRSPMPAFDAAHVLHITDQTWDFAPVKVNDEVFRHFLHLRETFRWEKELSKTVLGKPIASADDDFVTGTQRRG